MRYIPYLNPFKKFDVDAIIKEFKEAREPEIKGEAVFRVEPELKYYHSIIEKYLDALYKIALNKGLLSEQQYVYERCGVGYYHEHIGTAGRAHYADNRITLSIPYLLKHKLDFIKETVTHELAHLIAYQKYGGSGKGHNQYFYYVLSVLGGKLKRTHDYGKLPGARQVERPYTAVCGCPEGHKLTQLLYRRMRQGQQRYCRRCGQTLELLDEQ